MSNAAVVTPPTSETPAPAPGSPAALALAGDVRGFMAARDAQMRGDRVPAEAQPAADLEPPVTAGDPAAVVPPPEGEQVPAAGDAPPQTEDERAAAEESARVSEAARTLNEAKKGKKSRADEIREEIAHETWRKHKLREEAAAEEARIAALRAQREALERQPDKPAEPPAFDPGPEPKVEDFTTYEAYVKAQAKWEARIEAHAALELSQKAIDERLAAERQAAFQRAQAADNDRLLAAHNARVAEFVQKTPDYAEVIEAARLDPVRSQLPAVIGGYMMQSDMGPQLAYALATMPIDEFRQIQSLTPDLALAAVGRLEGRLLARQTSHPPGPTPARNPVSPAARPIQPVGTSATVTAIPSQELVQRDPLAWMQQRDADDRRRRTGR